MLPKQQTTKEKTMLEQVIKQTKEQILYISNNLNNGISSGTTRENDSKTFLNLVRALKELKDIQTKEKQS